MIPGMAADWIFRARNALSAIMRAAKPVSAGSDSAMKKGK